MTICFENCDTLKLHSYDIKRYEPTNSGLVISLKKSADVPFYHFGMKGWASTVFERLCKRDITDIHTEMESCDITITVPYEPEDNDLGSPNRLQTFKIDDRGELTINISFDGEAHFAETEDVCGSIL